jgi:hypothetical protein
MRLSVHCQSPELQQPARAGKVGASGPQAQRHGTDFTDRFPKIAADAVENLRVRSCVLDDGCSGRKARSMDDKKNRISAPPAGTCSFWPRSGCIRFVGVFVPMPRIRVAPLHSRVTRFTQCPWCRVGLSAGARRLIDGAVWAGAARSESSLAFPSSRGTSQQATDTLFILLAAIQQAPRSCALTDYGLEQSRLRQASARRSA